ncbi:phosphate acyltransferase PlsX [Peptoniphilus sp. oral taxon 386]|uniref:phosphate acyltransferase PlsX n=1 Tax=Peptoniphilus sp. oral taxon 386 TaxID=652713 RepID=UPI00031CC4F6|nr:phosphate acyltransferase PlsX [Peptoniphilus sp. oral taxon 386]
MKILFDTLGGDNGSYEVIKGAFEAKKEFDIDIAFVGKENEIMNITDQLDQNIEFEIINASEKIENDEEPAFALRKKKDSSIVVGLKALKEKKVDAFVSAGSTGALLAGGLFIVGRVENIKRAVLPTAIPNLKGSTLLIDSGANMDCDESLLLQFAKMGKIYLEASGNHNPKVGLLNVGTEKGKGNSVVKNTYELLEKSDLNFIGNIEARDVTLGVCDLVVCDGFVGNVLLKNTEGVAYFLTKLIEKSVAELNLSKDSLIDIKMLISKLSKRIDYHEVGGAILLGLNEVVIKAHGSSDYVAIKNAAKVAVMAVKADVVKNLGKIFKE